MIALADFAAGAMENWGLVTFRDNLVLFDPQRSSTQSEEAIATVVTHELGHQVRIFFKIFITTISKFILVVRKSGHYEMVV